MFGSGKNSRERCFSPSWYEKFPFIEYSVSCNAIFCFACRFFLTGYQGWKTISISLKKHEGSKFHKDSMVGWTSFKQSKETGSVASQLDQQRRSTVQENRQYLQQISKVVLHCARQLQDLALRGHDESEDSSNRGKLILF